MAHFPIKELMLSYRLLKLISTRTTFAIGGSVYKSVCVSLSVYIICMLSHYYGQ